MATAEPARFDGKYSPNYAHLICRFRVAVKERALLALHFESDLPAGFKVHTPPPKHTLNTSSPPPTHPLHTPCTPPSTPPEHPANTPQTPPRYPLTPPHTPLHTPLTPRR